MEVEHLPSVADGCPYLAVYRLPVQHRELHRRGAAQEPTSPRGDLPLAEQRQQPATGRADVPNGSDNSRSRSRRGRSRASHKECGGNVPKIPCCRGASHHWRGWKSPIPGVAADVGGTQAVVKKLSPGMTSQPGDPVNHDKTAVVGGVLVAAPRLVWGARSLIGGLRGVDSALRGAAGRTGQVTATAGRAAPRRSPGPLVVLRWQLAVVSRYAGCSTSGETPPSRGSSNLDGESWIWQAVR